MTRNESEVQMANSRRNCRRVTEVGDIVTIYEEEVGRMQEGFQEGPSFKATERTKGGSGSGIMDMCQG